MSGEGLICELLAEDALGRQWNESLRGSGLHTAGSITEGCKGGSGTGFCLCLRVCLFHDNPKRQALVPPFQTSELKLRQVTQPAPGLGSE